MARQSNRGRNFDPSDRAGEQIRRILGEELTRIEDERLDLVTISGVDVDVELTFATVYFSPLDIDDYTDALEAFDEHHGRLKRALSRSRMRRTPQLRFEADPGIRAGDRIEGILRDLDDGGPAGG